MGVAVQKGAGQGILRGDGALGQIEGVRVGSSSTMARRRRASATDMPSRDGTWRNGSGTARATVRVIQSPASSAVPHGQEIAE